MRCEAQVISGMDIIHTDGKKKKRSEARVLSAKAEDRAIE